VSRPYDPDGGALGARSLPPRLDPRAGRPPRSRTRPGGSASTSAPTSTSASGRRPRNAGVVKDHGGSSVRHPGPTPRFGRVLGLTTVGALVPGTGFLAAGYKKIGWTLIAGFVLLIGLGAWLATSGKHVGIRLAVSPSGLLLIIAAAIGLAVVWALVVIAQYRVPAPDATPTSQHMVGSLLVVLLALGVAAPAFEAAHLAAVQRNLITGLFGKDVQSATVPDSAKANPWGSKDRVNVLLLGGDGGSDREGVRTDSVIVASIDTHTGATTTFSLPRNLENVPFPANSPLHKIYPNGFTAGSESESLLNAIYRNGPRDHPNVLGPTDNPGADFLKLAVGEVLGLTIDYFVMVNLDGFSQLIDALGGITVNVNYWVPIGGEPTLKYLPDDYFTPGPNQHMDGWHALMFARGRYGLTDYQRMDRQRCMINAMVTAADPMTLLSRYQQIAASTQNIVTTDIPQAVVGDFADLALKVKDAGITSVVFDASVIKPAYPDYAKIRSMVEDALHPPSPGASSGPAPTTPTTPTSTAAGGSSSGSGAAPSSAAAPSAGASASPAVSATDACAYDAKGAQAELAKGEPPTKRRR
jgi:polyisoprenyl-teichoic acid--peptidoglycan teichoic acid transferase